VRLELMSVSKRLRLERGGFWGRERRSYETRGKINTGRNLKEENMSFFKQLGVNYLMVNAGLAAGQPDTIPVVSKLRQGDYWEKEDLRELKQWVESRGLKLPCMSRTPFSRWIRSSAGCRGAMNRSKTGIDRSVIWVLRAYRCCSMCGLSMRERGFLTGAQRIRRWDAAARGASVLTTKRRRRCP